jgi:apolipoprotein D and lipocalin family protein
LLTQQTTVQAQNLENPQPGITDSTVEKQEGLPAPNTSQTIEVAPSAEPQAMQATAQTQSGSPRTVESVDVARYTGQWYEIAAIPMFFERKCVANTTAEYTRQADGKVTVFNSCEKSNGKRLKAVGEAKVVDPKTNAKLKVSFLNFPLLGWQYWASGHYWIIDLAPDYSTAIIGHPNRKYGWILSRTPQLPMNTLKALAQKLSDQGYNPCDLMITPQKGGLQQKQPLCVVTSETPAKP